MRQTYRARAASSGSEPPALSRRYGAIDMVKDEKLSSLTPDYAFTLDNYPGLELGKVAPLAIV